MKIRIFIGTEPKTEIPRKVLQSSIIRRTNADVEFIPMLGPEWEYPITGIKVGTGFSLRRWMAAKACNWEGFAIYMDADQQVFGDVEELLSLGQKAMGPDVSTAMTYQPDKFSASPWPQSSVMVIDCQRAKQEWCWHIDKILEYLRANTSTRAYADFMHGKFLDQPPGRLPVEWNHLNVYEKDKTRLLHYTSEPTQVWYFPDHPLTYLWIQELFVAMDRGIVTAAEIEEAVGNFGKQEDWRKTNGLHPYYLTVIQAKRGAVPETTTRAIGQANPLWVTSFSDQLLAASGRPFMSSWQSQNVCGDLLVGLEGVEPAVFGLKPAQWRRAPIFRDVLQENFLKNWISNNSGVIPKKYGGRHIGNCTCPAGPLPINSEKHKPGCVGYWFNHNAARWARKAAILHRAADYARMSENKYTHIIWVDADCTFTGPVTAQMIDTWFHGKSAFYLKSTRPVMETGVFGFDLRKRGTALLRAFLDRYSTGTFRSAPRWDDSYQLQQVLLDPLNVTDCVDIAQNVTGNADVVPTSELARCIAHDKGRHGRKLGIF